MNKPSDDEIRDILRRSRERYLALYLYEQIAGDLISSDENIDYPEKEEFLRIANQIRLKNRLQSAEEIED